MFKKIKTRIDEIYQFYVAHNSRIHALEQKLMALAKHFDIRLEEELFSYVPGVYGAYSGYQNTPTGFFKATKMKDCPTCGTNVPEENIAKKGQ